ncbi:AmmeMemoRadiSam system radical SAM enzyme [bacterium]
MLKEAKYYTVKDSKTKTVQCVLCPHCCIIENEKFGRCRVRKNKDGVLYALAYSKISALNIDPIEKKPLYHYYPGKNIISLGSVGCNMHCAFCQNYDISQTGPENLNLEEIFPQKLLELVKKEDNIGAAYTYNEPFINYEYIFDCTKLLHENGFKNIFVTNGFINPLPLKEIVKFIDAANIDFKADTEDFYTKICDGKLSNVKKTIEIMYENNVFIELTNLLIPELNDTDEEITSLVKWIRNIDPKIPLHFSRYFPCYKMNIKATSIDTLIRAYNIAKEYLDYVYIGNILLDKGNDTICPFCKKAVIQRQGYSVRITGMDNGRCRYCGKTLNIIS